MAQSESGNEIAELRARIAKLEAAIADYAARYGLTTAARKLMAKDKP